jgi:phosphoribosylformylglycinamidine synthase
MWQFTETVEGISEACESLGIPVVGGNVSFYNETNGIDIYPTPIVGMLGLADPMPPTPPRLGAGAEGMEIWLIGCPETLDLAGSAFSKFVHNHVGGRPAKPDPQTAGAVIELATRLASNGAVPVLHDVSDGGLAVAMAEICIQSKTGARLEIADWRGLFAEPPHTFVAVAPAEVGATVQAAAEAAGVAVERIGKLGGDAIEFAAADEAVAALPLKAVESAWRNAIRARMEP